MYVPASNANGRSLESLLEEYRAVRMASISLFSNFDEDAFIRQGFASGHRLTVRAAAYFIAGHEQHHMNSIQENYLS